MQIKPLAFSALTNDVHSHSANSSVVVNFGVNLTAEMYSSDQIDALWCPWIILCRLKIVWSEIARTKLFLHRECVEKYVSLGIHNIYHIHCTV